MSEGLPVYWWLRAEKPGIGLPPVDQALEEPNGLLAVGGDLEPDTLISAYRDGVFPWYSEGQSILWWSPDPRTVLFPGQLKISRSLAKRLRKGEYRVTCDQAFTEVIDQCAAPRRDGPGTWITAEMNRAYRELHRMNLAHSVETWRGDELIGGLYGVCIGGVFFGESMFHRCTDASKVALVTLVARLLAGGIELIDCQVGSAHLRSLGAVDLPRETFLHLIRPLVNRPSDTSTWDNEHAV